MVKTIREGENRRNSRTASSAGTRSKEEQTASQIRSPGSMKRDTPVDPTERPDSTFMTASKQPALTLIALAAAEGDGRQLPDSAFASENQAACMNPTSSTDRITISSSATSACIAPARDSPLFPNEPALPQTTGEDLFPPPVGSTDPRKTDATPSAAASSPGNPRGSDGPTGDACESTTGTRCFPTAIMYDATLGTRTLGEVRGPRTSEEDLRGRDGTTAGAPGGELGRDTASFENPRATDGPSKGGGLSPKDLPLRSLVSGDAIVQDCSTVLQPVRPEGHLAVLVRRLGTLREPMVHQGGELSPEDLFLMSQDSSDETFSRAETRSVPPKIFASCCPTRAIMPARICQKSRSFWSQTPRPRASHLSRLCLVPGCSRKFPPCSRETGLLSVRNPPKRQDEGQDGRTERVNSRHPSSDRRRPTGG